MNEVFFEENICFKIQNAVFGDLRKAYCIQYFKSSKSLQRPYCWIHIQGKIDQVFALCTWFCQKPLLAVRGKSVKKYREHKFKLFRAYCQME